MLNPQKEIKNEVGSFHQNFSSAGMPMRVWPLESKSRFRVRAWCSWDFTWLGGGVLRHSSSTLLWGCLLMGTNTGKQHGIYISILSIFNWWRHERCVIAQFSPLVFYLKPRSCWKYLKNSNTICAVTVSINQTMLNCMHVERSPELKRMLSWSKIPDRYTNKKGSQY